MQLEIGLGDGVGIKQRVRALLVGARVVVLEDAAVDDDVADVDVLRLQFAREALRQPGPIDLLFTDMVMPGGVSGVTLAREARRGRPQLRVLLTTGYAGVDTPGAEEFPLIAKPFRRAGLSCVVAGLLADEESAGSGS